MYRFSNLAISYADPIAARANCRLSVVNWLTAVGCWLELAEEAKLLHIMSWTGVRLSAIGLGYNIVPQRVARLSGITLTGQSRPCHDDAAHKAPATSRFANFMFRARSAALDGK